MDESKLSEPIEFEEEEFNDIKKFLEDKRENKYVLEKEEDNLYYFSRKDYDTEGLRMSIFLLEGERFKQIAYIDSIYDPAYENLYISILNVNPSYRNSGYGTLIYNAFEATVLNLFQIKSINGKLLYWKEGKKRERFFESLGFELSSSWNDGKIDEIRKDFEKSKSSA